MEAARSFALDPWETRGLPALGRKEEMCPRILVRCAVSFSF